MLLNKGVRFYLTNTGLSNRLYKCGYNNISCRFNGVKAWIVNSSNISFTIQALTLFH